MHTILILTVSIGNGHNQAAFNMNQALHSLGYTVKVIDFLQIEPYHINYFLSKAYQKLLDYKPAFFRQICKISETESFDNIHNLLAKMNRRIIARLVEQEHPAMVICTHFFPLAAAAAYKQKYHAPFKLVGIVTDYTIHPVWDVANVDQYFVAHPSLVSQIKHNRPPIHSVIPSGIPIGSNFTPSASRQHNLNKILVMTSGQTASSMSDLLQVLQSLPPHIEITFITGKDHERQKQLEKFAADKKNFHVYGYTDQIAFYMKDTDLLITKPGGLTITEALATATPLLLFSPIPGIEEENAKFLETQKLAYWAHNKHQLFAHITQLINSPAKRAALSEKMFKLPNSQATTAICSHLTNSLEPERRMAL
ncbi:MGDG synthase family glycosyltransferase [Anaerosinus massiliensis]|uniref:MGDG synthase family glycosyltransferase n=1 Tax=Massilibacillus massiliensis TaxID=1806837 RepID=UPI000B16FE14|nr:glycosyltransferase [Massilibacillus massiliensis]